MELATRLDIFFLKLVMILYQQKQRELFDRLEEKFKKGERPATIVEAVSDYINDNRICLTSVVFVQKTLRVIIDKKLIKPLREADPRQYYHLPQSFHLTIQNIRTINHPPLFNDGDIAKAKIVFEKVIPKYRQFEFKLEGLFELPTSLGIRAFSDDTIKNLCFELRKRLKAVGVPDNKKYISDEIIIGNVSVCRYTQPPNNAFLAEVKKLKNVEIGQLPIKTISLITTNAVCHPKWTRIVKEFVLMI